MNGVSKSPLNIKERARFKFCKERIQLGLKTVWETSGALAEIRDDKLYREEFDTFEEFCEKTYQIGKSQTYRLIEAHEVRKSLGKLGEKITSEKQARALAEYSPEERKEIVKEISKNGPVTTEKIANFQCQPSRNVSPQGDFSKDKTKEKPLIELDATGYPIPPEALEFWHRRQEIQDLMTTVSKAKTLIERAREEGDPLFTRINQSATNNLSMAFQHIVEAKPYAVCLYCQGHHTLNGGCRHCLGMGVVSQFFYEKKSREEDRKIREASLKLKSK